MNIIMYSAESTLQDINAVDDTQHKIDCIKEYALQVAKQVLIDASISASIVSCRCYEPRYECDSTCREVDKQTILETEIQTP